MMGLLYLVFHFVDNVGHMTFALLLHVGKWQLLLATSVYRNVIHMSLSKHARPGWGLILS
jgi:hypothetical protein